MILRHLRSNVVAYLALLNALTSTSYAAVQIANGSGTTKSSPRTRSHRPRSRTGR